MARRLFLQLPADDETNSRWLLQDTAEPAATCTVHEGMEEASLQATGCQVIVIVSGVNVVLTGAHLPTRNRQRIRSALPFMLEDQLAQEIEQLHFAIGQREADGQVNAAVVERRHIAAWLARLRAYDIEPDIIVPDILCLPWTAGHWSLLRENAMALLRTASQRGVAVDDDNLGEMFAILLADTGEKQDIQTVDDYTREAPPLSLPETIADNIECNRHDAPQQDTLALLATHYDDSSAINLLQGDFSRREQFEKLWRPWRPALAILLAIILISAVLTATDYIHFRKEQQQLATTIKKIYLDSFPDARRVVNPRVQMSRRLAARENRWLVAGSAVALILILYGLVWVPFDRKVRQLQLSVSKQQQLANWMQQQSREVRRLRSLARSGASVAGKQSLLALTDQTAKQAGLGSAIKRVEPEGQDKVRIRMEQVVFDDLIVWLEKLQRRQRIRIARISIDRQDTPGRVDARLTLEKAP